MNLLESCCLKTKHYMPNIKKYILMAIKIYAIGMPILCIVFNMVVNPEFRTIEYKISSCLFRMSMFSTPIIISYLIYKILIPKNKISIFSEIIRLIIAIPLMFILFSSIVFCFLNSYYDGSYDECMESCVVEDLSNYDECLLNTCDFPL